MSTYLLAIISALEKAGRTNNENFLYSFSIVSDLSERRGRRVFFYEKARIYDN